MSHTCEPPDYPAALTEPRQTWRCPDCGRFYRAATGAEMFADAPPDALIHRMAAKGLVDLSRIGWTAVGGRPSWRGAATLPSRPQREEER